MIQRVREQKTRWPRKHKPAQRSTASLPLAYESTGAVTQFTNSLEPDFRSREVFTFHRPEELARLVKLESQVRANVRALPAVTDEHLWKVQVT